MRRYAFPYIPNRPVRVPQRWTDTFAPLSCRRCSAVWEEGDPALRVPCRGCGAGPSEPCRRSKGGNERVCACRDEDAVRLGMLEPCEGLTWDGRHEKPLRLRAEPVPSALMCRAVRTGAPISRWG
ncbi:hypothetical protein D5366_11745 (plasmid) [Neokomagataea tanensis]|uniref:Uncharacterized protein n=1 Tax=Neokomagataea tanensis TaxID=661191 RepID=A0A4Y6VC97_9PROT|nr:MULTISPECIES: hypothetical protein [Neokomagataea]QDH26077.1 hypothetical protein D5366_11745 [Neokomagataea tanensis]